MILTDQDCDPFGANLFVLCRTRSTGEMGAVFSVPFSLQDAEMRPTRERLKRCGSLTAGDH